MWELDCEEGWAPKNWCFWTVVLEKTLKSPLDCKEIQPVLLKEISPWCSLEGMILKLKLQYFAPPMRRVDLLEKTLMLGRTGGRRKRGRQRMRWLDGVTDSVDVSLSETPGVGDRVAWRAVIHEVAKSWTRLSNWTDWTETHGKVVKKRIVQWMPLTFKLHILALCVYTSLWAPISAELLQSYPTVCDSMDCSPPGSSVHGVLQARKLGCTAMLVPYSPTSHFAVFDSSSHTASKIQKLNHIYLME